MDEKMSRHEAIFGAALAHLNIAAYSAAGIARKCSDPRSRALLDIAHRIDALIDDAPALGPDDREDGE